jgi:hypothetical protein
MVMAAKDKKGGPRKTPIRLGSVDHERLRSLFSCPKYG